MTLKEAHEIQRRELISLRAKVARLEKQSSGLKTLHFLHQLCPFVKKFLTAASLPAENRALSRDISHTSHQDS